MNKVSMLLIIFLSILTFSFNTGVYAQSNIYILDDNECTGDSCPLKNTSEVCPAFGDPKDSESFAYLLQSIFNYVKFAGILLAIIMTVKDLFSAVAEQKADTFQKLGNKTIKRVIYAVLIFMLPIIINFVFSIVGLYGTCAIS